MARLAEDRDGFRRHGAHRHGLGGDADAFASVADVSHPRPWPACSSSSGDDKVAAAIQRSMMLRSRGCGSRGGPTLVMGFPTCCSPSSSQHLSDRELAEVVGRFEDIFHDIVTAQNGRVVEIIGDEVMFVVSSVLDAARIGLDLADAYADDELLSDVRVGLALGPVLLRDGGSFGPTSSTWHTAL